MVGYYSFIHFNSYLKIMGFLFRQATLARVPLSLSKGFNMVFLSWGLPRGAAGLPRRQIPERGERSVGMAARWDAGPAVDVLLHAALLRTCRETATHNRERGEIRNRNRNFCYLNQKTSSLIICRNIFLFITFVHIFAHLICIMLQRLNTVKQKAFKNLTCGFWCII